MACEYRQNCRQKVFKLFKILLAGKLSAVYVNQTNLNVKLSTKLGGHQAGASQKSGGIAHPGPLRTDTEYCQSSVGGQRFV